jgi:hypothetical protein
VLSLCRRWQQQAKQTEVRALLAPIDAWFTEGFDTAALQKAKALLETLAGERSRDSAPRYATPIMPQRTCLITKRHMPRACGKGKADGGGQQRWG